MWAVGLGLDPDKFQALLNLAQATGEKCSKTLKCFSASSLMIAIGNCPSK